ncbi:uncharacterized protein [Haliotis cracherodii]|uniref:uncharacterized protein isoform X2 n=1 Tax=Haliotis cracherodii TaxID=6455 RepID=UPI0039EC602F
MDKRVKMQVGKKNCAVESLTLFHDKVQKQFIVVDEERRNRISSKFENGFMNVLLQCFGDKKVEASEVYMKYMLNKGNVHISKTRWKALDEFVRYQGRVGRVHVDYSSKIWYVQHPQKVEKASQALPSHPKLCFVDSNFVTQSYRNIRKPAQKEMCKNSTRCDDKPGSLPKTTTDSDSRIQNGQKWSLKRDKVTFKMSPRRSPYNKEERPSLSQKCHGDIDHHVKPNANRKSTLAEIMEEEEKLKEKMNRRDSWLQKGIVVTIITDRYGRSNYRKNCRIVGLLSPFTGLAHVLCNDNVLIVDQKYLMTLVPEVGGLARIVNGAYRGERGVVERFSTCQKTEAMCCVRLKGSPLSGCLLAVEKDWCFTQILRRVWTSFDQIIRGLRP